jgi:hypothetical protein
MADIKSTNLKSTATVYPENRYAEFSTFFRVKFTEDVVTKPINSRALELDIIGTFADVIIRALEARMDSCVSMLMRNSDKVMFADEMVVQFKKNNGQIHTFNHSSFEVMQDAVNALENGNLAYVLDSEYTCDQIAKALYWVPEEDRKERNGIGFGRLVSVIINNLTNM